MVRLEIWSYNPNEWHAQLRDALTAKRIGDEWISDQRGGNLAAIAELHLDRVLIDVRLYGGIVDAGRLE